jgi:DNA-binding protein H-NS
MPNLESIQARLKKLQAQADVLIAKKAQAAVDQIRQLMLKHGLTTKDIEAKAKAKREAKATLGHASNGKARAVVAKGKLPPKYRDPKTGAVWSGHARAPSWIANAKDRSKFLIDGSGAAANAGVARKAVARKVAKKAGAKAVANVRKVVAKKGTAAVKKPVAAKKTAAAAAKKARGRKTTAKPETASATQATTA